MKKMILFALAVMISNSATAQALVSAQISNKALQILIAESKDVVLDGDVHKEETLPQLLASALAPVEGLTAKVVNTCVEKAESYKCQLDIQYKYQYFTAETVITYEVLAGEGRAPEKLVGQKVYVSRGH